MLNWFEKIFFKKKEGYKPNFSIKVRKNNNKKPLESGIVIVKHHGNIIDCQKIHLGKGSFATYNKLIEITIFDKNNKLLACKTIYLYKRARFKQNGVITSIEII